MAKQSFLVKFAVDARKDINRRKKAEKVAQAILKKIDAGRFPKGKGITKEILKRFPPPKS